MSGGGCLWERSITAPSLRDVLKLSVDGSPTRVHQGCLERTVLPKEARQG